MAVVECETPSSSALNASLTPGAYYRDAFRAPLLRPRASTVDIFFAIFGHHPAWMKFILIARNAIASLCGLDAPKASEIMHVQVQNIYRVGDTIGVWPIYAMTDNELVAGRDNKHLDFRLSVLKEPGGENPYVVVTTVCTVHNRFGKVYLFFIVPFHRWGVRQLLLRASRADRL